MLMQRVDRLSKTVNQKSTTVSNYFWTGACAHFIIGELGSLLYGADLNEGDTNE